MTLLFLDLSKAVAVPNTGTDHVSEGRDARKYNESFARRGSGVLGGDASPDDPEVGKKWRNSDEGGLEAELEEARKLDSEKAQEQGIVPKAKEEAKKALQALTDRVSYELRAGVPNVREVEYLLSKGHAYESIMKGQVHITGRDRALFNQWLHSRLVSSVDRLRK